MTSNGTAAEHRTVLLRHLHAAAGHIGAAAGAVAVGQPVDTDELRQAIGLLEEACGLAAAIRDVEEVRQ